VPVDLGRIKRVVSRAVSVVSGPIAARFALPEGRFPAARDWVADLRSLRWLDDDRFELTGWAYDRDVDYTGTRPVVRVWAQSDGALPRFIPLEVTIDPSPEANQPSNGATRDTDYSGNCFRAVGSLAQLCRYGTRQWSLRVSVAAGPSQVQGQFTKVYGLGPAGYRTSRRCASGTALPRWSKNGLGILVVPLLPTATGIDTDGDRLSIDVAHRGTISSAVLVSPQGRTKLEVRHGPEGSTLVGSLPAIDPSRPWQEANPGVWGYPVDDPAAALPWLQHRVLVRTGGGEQPVLIGSGQLIESNPLRVEAGPDGELRLDAGTTWAVITGAELVGDDKPVLRVTGRCSGDLAGARFTLANQRDTRSGSVAQDGGSFIAEIGLLESHWNLAALPPQIGRLTLAATTAGGLAIPVRCAPGVMDKAPDSVWNRWFRLYYSVKAGKVLAPRLAIPLSPEEIGTHNQARIRAQYESGAWPIVDKMYFESFYGRQCGCNPLALREEMVARHPNVPRVWAVRDLSVAVPEGDEAVVDASTAWWRARAESRWLVVNDWLRARFTPREGQTTLQTWHGTMYKKVGLDRGEQLDAEEREFMLGERKKWDLLLSQNPHSSRVFRESYLSNPPIYEEGYPRNDLLVNGSGEPIRNVLGIRADQKVVLYAPTWRDDRTELVDYLDVSKLAADLGDGYVVLLRAHSRVIRVGSAAKVGAGVIDVSTYPNTTDLLLIADIMITDYSSIMFDFAVTGRPMIFFTPDMEDYRDQLRGVYLDLEEVGPGPVVSTQDEVLATILGIDEVAHRFAERYRQWQADYTPWDDGGSSARVLDRLLVDAPPADPAILD
jgi:CDP-glycerol glycerophosphotransferase (TagB/SpsB family)